MNDLFNQVDNRLLLIDAWENDNVIAGFTTRQSGVSDGAYQSLNVALHVNDSKKAVMENRQIVSESLNVDINDWICLNQIHSRRIIDLTERDDLTPFTHEPQIEADGLLTNKRKQFLVNFYADCVPLYFKSKDSEWIGIAHAGWKGTVDKIGPEMIKMLKNKGISEANIEVVIGPAISKLNYEVDDNVIKHIPLKYREEVLQRSRPNHYFLDLKRLNELILVDAGIKPTNIHVSSYCTYRDEKLFFSHRRDQGKTGRMMAFIYKQ